MTRILEDVFLSSTKLEIINYLRQVSECQSFQIRVTTHLFELTLVPEVWGSDLGQKINYSEWVYRGFHKNLGYLRIRLCYFLPNTCQFLLHDNLKISYSTILTTNNLTDTPPFNKPRPQVWRFWIVYRSFTTEFLKKYIRVNT